MTAVTFFTDNGKMTGFHIVGHSTNSEKDIEGCLSVPGRYGYVLRPEKVKVTALDRNGEKIEIEATGMLKKALCHEIDHLDGIVFVDKVTQYVEVDN